MNEISNAHSKYSPRFLCVPVRGAMVVVGFNLSNRLKNLIVVVAESFYSERDIYVLARFPLLKATLNLNNISKARRHLSN